ncbi:MAG TPA: SDR family oxidoreductase [Trueperaceae bacterium]|nr:SDR family oxidoreductase [Trueperaceae bacterium]
MSTIAVTGSTGALGTLAIDQLLKRVPASQIVAIARSEDKAAALRTKGVEVRIADYDQPSTLAQALRGVDKVLLISANEVGKRFPQHSTVIDAAKAAGVSFIAYTSLLHAPTSDILLAPEHVQTEQYIAASGIDHAFLRNGWYHENYLGTLEQVRQTGVLVTSVGAGKVSSASREDFAEAAAIVISQPGHAGKAYELAGDVAWTHEELAEDFESVIGIPVVLKNLSADAHLEALEAAGVPDGARQFVVSLDQSAAAGALEDHSRDLSKLLGRPTTPLRAVLRQTPVASVA